MNELKAQIQSSVNKFSSGKLIDNAKDLLNVLGYASERTWGPGPKIKFYTKKVLDAEEMHGQIEFL